MKCSNKVVANALKANNARAIVKNGEFARVIDNLYMVKDKEERKEIAKKYLGRVKAESKRAMQQARDFHKQYDANIKAARVYKQMIEGVGNNLDEMRGLAIAAGDAALAQEIHSMMADSILGSFILP